MRRNLVSLLLVILFVLPVSAFELSGLVRSDEARIRIGQEIRRNITIGAQVGGLWRSIDIDNLYFGGFAEYALPDYGNLTPYIGAQCNYLRQNGVTGIMYGPSAGVKFKVDNRLYLFLQAEWQFYDGNIGALQNDRAAYWAGIGLKL